MLKTSCTSVASISATKASVSGSIGSVLTSLTRSRNGGPKPCGGARHGSGTWTRSSSAEGRRADILLLNEDPAADLGALTRWRFVAAGGRLYSREEIDAAVRRYQRHFHGRFYSWIMNWIVSIVASDAEHAKT